MIRHLGNNPDSRPSRRVNASVAVLGIVLALSWSFTSHLVSVETSTADGQVQDTQVHFKLGLDLSKHASLSKSNTAKGNNKSNSHEGDSSGESRIQHHPTGGAGDVPISARLYSSEAFGVHTHPWSGSGVALIEQAGASMLPGLNDGLTVKSYAQKQYSQPRRGQYLARGPPVYS